MQPRFRMLMFIPACICLLLMACQPSGPARNSPQPQEPAGLKPDSMITEQQAREIADEIASQAYRDLSIYTVSCRQEGGNWFVDYELSDTTLDGGGPHFVIDAHSGEVLQTRFEQ